MTVKNILEVVVGLQNVLKIISKTSLNFNHTPRAHKKEMLTSNSRIYLRFAENIPLRNGYAHICPTQVQ